MTLPTVHPMPTFTIKAQDALAVPTLRAYYNECLEHGLHDQADEVAIAIEEMRAWQRDHVGATKLPDHPHVPTYWPAP